MIKPQINFSWKYGYNPFIFKKFKITSIKQVVEADFLKSIALNKEENLGTRRSHV